MKSSRCLLFAAAVLLAGTQPGLAITIDTVGKFDAGNSGILTARTDWAEIHEVESYVSDAAVTAGGSFSVFNVGPQPWNKGLWLFGGGAFVQTVFGTPADSLFVQFEADTNDGNAQFWVDGALVHTENTFNAGWYAVIISDLPVAAHTLRVVASDTGFPRDVAIDVIGTGAPRVPMPEPGTLGLLAIGLVGLGWLIRRRHVGDG